uniref:T-complex protein 1 beta subunit (TCP-1-beta) n=1 Tax=Solanum tuberosum TaxID=4113 RepID=M1AAN8_SOLTU
MAELGISEAFKVKQAVLLSATEAAEMILRLMKSSHMPHGGGKTECKPGLDVLNLLRCLYSIMLKL